MRRASPLDVDTAARRAREVSAAFLQLTPARASASARRSVGVLAGMPFAVKDVFDVRGTRTSAGSQLFDRRPPAVRDAEAVQRLHAAGAVVIGKTVLSELAFSGLGVNRRFGTPTVDRDGVRYVVGGSSSGSAAAVRSGVVPFALASDTSGSARIPAAWTGTYGYRPSLGRYPTAGMIPLASTLDTVGLIADSIETLMAVDGVLAGDTVATAGLPSCPTLIAPDDAYLSGCDVGVLERFHASIAALRAAGWQVQQRRVDALHHAADLHRRHVPLVEAEAFAAFGGYLSSPGLLSGEVTRRLRNAADRLNRASDTPLRNAMTSLRARLRQELGEAVLLTPPSQIDPPAESLIADSAEAHDVCNSRALWLTMQLAYLDAPSLVIPLDDADDLRGIQLSAAGGGDRRVLTTGAAILEPHAVPEPAFEGERR